MPNLLEETIKALADNNKTPADVLWVEKMAEPYNPIGIYEAGSWEDFALLANREYTHIYQYSSLNYLRIVGDGWWLERHQQEGSNYTGQK